MSKKSLKKYLQTNKGRWHFVNKPLMAKALNFTCQKCRRQFNTKRLNIHHFDYNYKSAIYEYGWEELYQNDVVTLLCVTCHTWWHQNNSIYGHVDKKGPDTMYCFNCGYEDFTYAYSECKKCKIGKMQCIQYKDFQEKIIVNESNCRECGIWWHRAEEIGIYFDFDEKLCQNCIVKINQLNNL